MSQQRFTRSALKQAILRRPSSEIDVITLSSDEECPSPEPSRKKARPEPSTSSGNREEGTNPSTVKRSRNKTTERGDDAFIEFTPERMAQIDIERHGKFLNAKEIQQLAVPGDMIEFFRLGEKISYFHYALYLGDGKVMNVEASSQMGIANVQEKDIKDVIKGSPMRIKNPDNFVMEEYGKTPKSTDEIIQAAKETAAKEKVPYHFVKNNCEHYCSLWRYGVAFSRQAEDQSRIHSGRAQAEILLNPPS